MSGLFTRPVNRTKPVLGAFIWMDRNRRYFIFIGGSMEKGQPYTRMQWRQEYPDPNEDPSMVELTIPHPITAYIYYIACGKFYRHNRCRQESIDIKNSWVLKIGRSGSIYLFLWLMWLMSGWHTNSSLGRRITKLISTIIWMKRCYITPTIG